MAERHWVNGGVNLLWSTTGNWSLTEGGAGGQAVPTAAEDVFFDAGSPDCTLNIQARVCKTLTASAYTNTLTFTYQLSVSGNITIGTNVKWSGTAKLIMLVAGTWTTNGNTIGVPITIGQFTAGTVTLADALTTSGDLQLINGTSTTFSGDFHITAATCTVSGSQTVILVHDVTITGLTIIADANVVNGFNWNTGGLTLTNFLTGTTTIVLTGGTLSAAANKYFANPLVFAGDVAISGTIYVQPAGVISWQSGTINAGTSTLVCNGNCTFDTEGMSWYNITIANGSFTITLNSLLSVIGTLTLPGADTTFAGTAGFSVGTFLYPAPVGYNTLTLVSGVTYTVTDYFNLKTTINYFYYIVASTPGTKAFLTLNYGATQDGFRLAPTDIDSSLGQAIYTQDGTITTCYNWSSSLGHGRIIPDAGGESVTVAGITKDNAGVALGSCDVYLFRDNGGDTATYIAYQESNSVTGAYSFTVFPGSAYFVVAFKGGATPVMDVTYRDLAAV